MFLGLQAMLIPAQSPGWKAAIPHSRGDFSKASLSLCPDGLLIHSQCIPLAS